ncbi:protein HIDE1 isoform X2 [Tursiops truncatus]|uniref:Protein HIDE1 isoform X2 n=1 Tax=Tursiops truncatus TaxID=9739 RepID=A0A6J3R6J3_TURTR|nr:protein HIDE1 isoform X2 [Globicephala melas]XP_033710197.1 protein HIDE1 isoform X2 [Tursiops truncatus]
MEGVGRGESPFQRPSVCVQLPANEETLGLNQPWFFFPCSGLTGGAGSEPWAALVSARFPGQTREERCPGPSCSLQPPPLSCFAGSLAIPAPSIMLVPPHPSSQKDPIHIACMAPRDFPGANFTLYQGEEVVQLLQAPVDQLEVIFNLSGGSREVPGGPFRCQYGVLGELRQPQLSNLSEPMHVSFPVKVKNLQKKRERESCWAQVNFATTDMSFDNSLFTISKMTSEEDAATQDAPSGSAATPGNSGTRKRPTSTSSSPEPPEFSTFRAC